MDSPEFSQTFAQWMTIVSLSVLPSSEDAVPKKTLPHP